MNKNEMTVQDMVDWLSKQKKDAKIRIIAEHNGVRKPMVGEIFIQGQHGNYIDMSGPRAGKVSGFKVFDNINVSCGYIGGPKPHTRRVISK